MMGQRFQSVFILPAVYMNKDNPNNRNEKVLGFHNQWLYGRGAINLNLSIMKRIKKGIQKRKDIGSPYASKKKDYINHFLENAVINAVKWAGLQELNNESKFHEPTEFIYSKENKLSLGEWLSMKDNNNGFFICKINKKLELSYCFISGTEDTRINKYVTPKEYLNLFYSDPEMKEQKIGKNSNILEIMNKRIKEYERFKVIPEEDIKNTIERLNQNIIETKKLIC